MQIPIILYHLCAEILVHLCIIPVEWEGKFCDAPWWLGLLITQLLALPATLVSSFVLPPPPHHLPCLFVIPSRYKPGVVLQAVPLLGLLEVCYGSSPIRLPHTHARNLGYEPESVVRVTATVLGGS